MKKYICCNIVDVETDGDNYSYYLDGVKHDISKEEFDSNFYEVPSGTGVDVKMVKGFIKDVKSSTIEGRTTLVRCVLNNGFVLIDSSTCVNPANYNIEYGTSICMERIEHKIWELLGFLMKTAKGEKDV